MQIAYLRVSTEQQDAQNQRKDVESIVEGEVEWVVEHGSAWKKDGLEQRPEFQRIYNLVKKGVLKTLYVWDLDRLYRKRPQQLAFLQLCKARGCLVLSYRQRFLEEVKKAPSPWNDIIYDLIIQVFAWMAEEESSKKSERIRIAKENFKRKAGKKEWGRPQAQFNERRAYHLLFVENPPWSLRNVAKEVGVSLGALHRSKKVWEINPPSFIKEDNVQERDD